MLTYLWENKWNITQGLVILSVLIILIYGAFFRKIEKINDEPEPEEDKEEPHWDIGDSRVKVIHKKK